MLHTPTFELFAKLDVVSHIIIDNVLVISVLLNLIGFNVLLSDFVCLSSHSFHTEKGT